MSDISKSLDARLQRRIQRYGWERAAGAYARYWHGPLAGVQGELLTLAALAQGEAVLDVACRAGVVSVAAAGAVGPTGRVVGVDLADAMVQAARQRAGDIDLGQARFELKLPRFRGHFLSQEGVRDSNPQAALSGGVSSIDGRAGPRRSRHYRPGQRIWLQRQQHPRVGHGRWRP